MDVLERVPALRYGLDGGVPQTLDEVGTELGITRDRVCELEEPALRETPTGAGLVEKWAIPLDDPVEPGPDSDEGP